MSAVRYRPQARPHQDSHDGSPEGWPKATEWWFQGMKVTFTPPKDNKVHTYCVHCLAETVTHHQTAKRQEVYRCQSCGHAGSRAVIIDPGVTWWLDSSKEYWHETAGVFVKNEDKFLFFKRIKHPFGLTVPAGHRDKGEDPDMTATREVGEETGLKVRRPKHITTDDIWGDECRRGADVHRWHIYAVALLPNGIVKVNSNEGSQPVWLTLEEALNHELTPAVRYIITRYARQLSAVAK